MYIDIYIYAYTHTYTTTTTTNDNDNTNNNDNNNNINHNNNEKGRQIKKEQEESIAAGRGTSPPSRTLGTTPGTPTPTSGTRGQFSKVQSAKMGPDPGRFELSKGNVGLI